MNGDNSMKKYVLILLLLFVFIIGIYDKSSAKSKGKYIIKHKDLTLKVIDKIYIGSMKYVGQNIYRDIFLGKNTGFTTNSLVISNGKKYAVLPLKNIKELNKNNKDFDIFKNKANPNVSSIITCDSCSFSEYQNKIMVVSDVNCKVDIKDNVSKFKVTVLDDNGAVDKLKYFPCAPEGRIAREMSPIGILDTFHNMNHYFNVKYSYDNDMYMAKLVLSHYPSLVHYVIIGTKDKVLLEDDFSVWNDFPYGAPYSMSPDMKKFAMVDVKYGKIRLFSFDNNSIKSDILTDISIKRISRLSFLLLYQLYESAIELTDDGYLFVTQNRFWRTKYKVYKIHDFTKPDGYEYIGENIYNPFYKAYGIRNNIPLKIDIIKNENFDNKTDISSLKYDLTMAVTADMDDTDIINYYLLYLEEVDEEVVENNIKKEVYNLKIIK